MDPDFAGTWIWTLLVFINISVILYFLVLNLWYLMLIGISFVHIKKQYETLDVHDFSAVFSKGLYKSYSIIVPAFNEEEHIVELLRTLLQQQYGEFEVIVVNDGSTDRTLARLMDHFSLYRSNRYVSDRLEHKPIRQIYASQIHPNLFVLDKENGQKADALNAGLNAARKDLFCAIDGDSILERDVLIKMLRSFARDEHTIAVGGIVRVANGCQFQNGELDVIKTPSAPVALIQVVEYIRSFLFGRTGWEYFDGLILISGAFGVFDRRAVLRVGGYYREAIGEDFELTLKLHRYFKKNDLPYNITFQPEPVCWTRVPETWAALSSQRNRWQRGLLQSLLRFRDMMFNRRYGFVGMVAMPFYFIFELLGPVVEVMGYIAVTLLLVFGLLPPGIGLLFFVIALLFGVILSVASLICDELTYRQYPQPKDKVKLVIASLMETFGYRQLHAWWRLKGIVGYIQGNLKWRNTSANPRMVNILYWGAFVVINLMILYLFYYGITFGNIPL